MAHSKAGELQAAAKSFPFAIDGTQQLYHCGYHSEHSYGAASYFIKRGAGNIIVDSPRFDKSLLKNIKVCLAMQMASPNQQPAYTSKSPDWIWMPYWLVTICFHPKLSKLDSIGAGIRECPSAFLDRQWVERNTCFWHTRTTYATMQDGQKSLACRESSTRRKSRQARKQREATQTSSWGLIVPLGSPTLLS